MPQKNDNLFSSFPKFGDGNFQRTLLYNRRRKRQLEMEFEKKRVVEFAVGCDFGLQKRDDRGGGRRSFIGVWRVGWLSALGWPAKVGCRARARGKKGSG